MAIRVNFCVFCVAIAFIAANCGATTMIEKMMRITDECKRELGIREDKLVEGREESCFYACVERKYGNIFNGKIATDKIVERLEMNKKMSKSVRVALIECLRKANEITDECVLYRALTRCIKKTP